MRRAFALLAACCLGACLRPVTAETVELAWERCDAPGAPDARLAQCSAVIDFEGAAPERRAAALIVRASIRSNEGQYARALADLGRAARIGGENAQVYLERGIVHQARGAYDNAIRDFDLALSLQPTLEAASIRRAEAFGNRATLVSEQIEELNRRLTESPTDAGLLNNRCWLRVTHDVDVEAALADCNASVLADPNSAAALDSRGLVNMKLGNFEAALADYEAALAKEPERGHYLYGRGLARIRLGQPVAGEADLVEAERLEPGVTALYRSYALHGSL